LFGFTEGFKGKSWIQGNLVRVEFSPGPNRLFLLRVKNEAYVWEEVPDSGSLGGKRIFRNPKGIEDVVMEGLVDLLCRPGGRITAKVLEILSEAYLLKCVEERNGDGISHFVVEGTLRENANTKGERDPFFLSDRLGIRPYGKIAAELIHSVRIMLRKEDLSLTRLEFFKETQGEATFSQKNLNYKKGHVIAENLFLYTPPEGASVTDLGVEYRKRLRLWNSAVMPVLPESDKAFFDAMPEEARMEVIVYPDGTYAALGNTDRGTEEIRAALLRALSFCEQKKMGQGPQARHLTDLDMVIYTSDEVPLSLVLALIKTANEKDIRVFRFHFGVRDRVTREEGILSFYLPVLFGTASGEKEEYEGTWLRIRLVQGSYGPEYGMADLNDPEGEWLFDSLESLDEAIETLRAESSEMDIVLTLEGLLTEQGMQAENTLMMKDFIDLLTFLASKDADLKRKRFNTMLNGE
jgi:hypothetical protein